ncbi:hypothetical protein [Tissierella sp. Yu-01]|uniref:hypothetical protein n=1 Tax=Tissierella sp. Yu-01 TaxID=3035694 RepID=UPI00240DC18C|nr:hypothetical protein [Tissierella sp. Yu-01]WFA10075.1 hypothetical protein P3962_05845 [Tissierella sp. Yu-01]
MIKKLRSLRKELLNRGDIICYRMIMIFLDSPNDNDIKNILKISSVELKTEIISVLYDLIDMYEDDFSRYKKEILYGQIFIWSQVLICYEELISQKELITTHNEKYYSDDYLNACKEINNLSKYYTKSQVAMSSFEEVFGVDRYLDRLCSEDIEPLVEIIFDIKKILELKSKRYKELFIKQWNTTNINKVIEHQLIRYNGENQVCTTLECNKRNVILLIIDGFGFSQYQWNKKLINSEINYTYNENIFSWLNRVNCIKELVLGSSHITDTSAGLAQIFCGQKSIKTGIISSKLSKKDINGFKDTKTLSIDEFEKYFDTSKCSITELVRAFNIESKVYYCSRYRTGNLGFSNYIFNGAEVEEVIPSERIFSVLQDDIDNLEQNKYLRIIYLTGLDNSGHTMGAYSKFEKFEHEKFNVLFRNFLIEIALEKPDLFNNETSIIITADHGMSESSRVMINRYDIKMKLLGSNIKNCRLIENNRALLIYGINNNNEITMAKNCLVDYFESINIDVDILDKSNDEYRQYYCINEHNKISDLSPDIIVKLIGNGLFYSKESSKHLLHYGGHGGGSFEEQFVPLLQLDLNNKLLNCIHKRFINII